MEAGFYADAIERLPFSRSYAIFIGESSWMGGSHASWNTRQTLHFVIAVECEMTPQSSPDPGSKDKRP